MRKETNIFTLGLRSLRPGERVEWRKGFSASIVMNKIFQPFLYRPPILQFRVEPAHDPPDAVRRVFLQPCGTIRLLQIAYGVQQISDPAVVMAIDFSTVKPKITGLWLLSEFLPESADLVSIEVFHGRVICQPSFDQ